MAGRKRRSRGEGTIHRRKDGRWQGAITVGRTADGKQKRRTVYGKTQGEVREKLDEMKRRSATGTMAGNKLTPLKIQARLGGRLEYWRSE